LIARRPPTRRCLSRTIVPPLPQTLTEYLLLLVSGEGRPEPLVCPARRSRARRSSVGKVKGQRRILLRARKKLKKLKKHLSPHLHPLAPPTR
jgi:hypothetical protein